MGGPIKIEELEGESVCTTDYFFVKIGESLPLKANDSNFDLETLPSQPLALSERFRLTFVAHSSGFYVARTKDLIDSAKEFKDKGSGSSVQELSLIDVPVGRVRILALSTDNSTLAASVAGDITFYSVHSFLSKEVKQSYFCSLNDSNFVKDMRWITTSENSYVVLSNTGELYHGETGCPLKHVMDSVEAVDWGISGTFIAVARKNVLSILSAKFEERVSISLSFKSWIGDSAANVNIKVDSVKCIRPDSIIIGCFQLTEDGNEENYLIQVIRSRLGEFTDDGSELVVQSFYDIYQGLIDDIIPLGSGPYLSLTYLEKCQLAINANKKNTDKLIMLLGWSLDDDHKSEAAVVEFERDKWIPRIELQENGDDNLLLGLCIDNVSIYEKVGVQLGVEERTELSPHCVLICLTLEGKLVMFHVASLAGSQVSREVDSVLHDEDTLVKAPVDESSSSSHGLQKKEQELDQAFEVSENLKSKPFANPYQITHTEDNTKHPEVESVTNLQSLTSNELQMVPDVDVNQDTDSQNPCPPGEQQKNLSQKTAVLGTSIGSFTINQHSAAPGLSGYNNLQKTTEMTKGLWNTNSSLDSQRASHLLPSGTFSFPKNSSVSPFSASSNAGYQSQKNTMAATNVHAANAPGSMGGKPFLVRDMNGASPAINSASRPVQSGGQLTSIGAGNIQSVLVGSSHLLSNENATTGKSSVRKFQPSNEQHGTSSKPAISSSDFSKQFGNINEMTKELDLLLKSIEEAGGFRDACTLSLRNSIVAVEQSMDTLSKQCKIWTCQVDQHLEQVHYLLNKTIQVVARKIYMEGIYKQASDSRYWDLWNRQRLNSELELKRQHILSLNQDLTYQLIELERHFNALELNKFSQYGGRHIGHGTFQNRYGPSRYVQSLHSLHNAISSQLVAAENLSECLSKQMAELSLRSPSDEQKNVKELFETIGIPYGASFGSPDVKGFMKTPSSKKLLFSDLTTNKDQSKRTQASAMKSGDPEMSRRRRDSLDQSWTSFEPPKTIIKRMLLQELQKPNRNESFLSTNKEKVKISMLEESSHQIDARIPSVVFPTKMKASILDSRLEFEEVSEHSKAFIQADNLRAPTQASDSKSHVLQRSNISAVQSRPAFQLSHATEKSNVAQKFDLISNSENKYILHAKMPQKSSTSTYSTTETPFSLVKSNQMPITNSKLTMATNSTMGDKLSSAFTPESRRKNFPSSESHSSTISTTSTLLGKVTEFNVDKRQPDENIPAVPTFSGSRESLSSTTIKTPSASPVSSSVSSASVSSATVSATLSSYMTSSNTSIDSNHIMPTSSASDFLYTSNQAPNQTVSSLPNPPCLNSTLESVKSKIQPAAVSNIKSDVDAAVEVVTQLNEPLNGESELKLESSRKFSPTNEQSSDNIKSSELKVVSASQSEQSSDAPLHLSTSFLASASVSSGKNGGLDVGISHEDEMEEEAPEISNTTELSLGSLGGFGISPNPNPSMPKPNPFGGSFNNVATSSPSSAITFSAPSGELFRPASFTFPSIQSSAPIQSTNSGAFSGGFGTGAAVPTQAPSVFGQPAQIGSGQQALGSVLGSFGQSRQLGSGLPGSGFAAPSGFGGGGFAGSSSTGGFSNAAMGGGFAARASTGGGFAGAASTGSGFSGFASVGGFAGTASTGGGFAAASSTGGFAGAGSGGGGFGAFSNQGSGGFGAFSKVGGSKPPELFTQMRK
ncbi:putative nuclear pore complex protein [Sesbania bispinosa]|nr:putative nuclear pore complex protein [Sesbania bispinosa]